MQTPSPIGDDVKVGQGTFHTTHWSVILTARDEEGTVAREALESLCPNEVDEELRHRISIVDT